MFLQVTPAITKSYSTNIKIFKAENFDINKAIIQKNELYTISKSQMLRFVDFDNK